VKILKFTQLSGRIVFHNKNLPDRKLTAFVFSLKNMRFFSFFMANTKGRHALTKKLSYTQNFTNPFKNYVKGSGTYDGLTSLAGKRVGIIVGGKQRADIEAVGGYAELTEYPTPYSLVEALAQDKIDVFAIQGSIADHFAKSFPQLNLESNPYESQSVAEAHVGVIVDKQNTKLLDDINAGIKKLKENGRLAEIQKKWLSEDLQKIQVSSTTAQ